jgi:biopolymer transport protein TolR
MSARGGSRPQSEINVTPLVDVLLVLMIIFMIIIPLVQKGFLTQLPPKEARPGGSRAIVLQVAADGSLSLNRESIKADQLGDRLSAVFAARQDKTLFVDADDTAPYESVVRALDVCRAPGRAETIGFVLN